MPEVTVLSPRPSLVLYPSLSINPQVSIAVCKTWWTKCSLGRKGFISACRSSSREVRAGTEGRNRSSGHRGVLLTGFAPDDLLILLSYGIQVINPSVTPATVSWALACTCMHIHTHTYTHILMRECRDGSSVKSMGCSFGGPGFDSQHPHGSSQISVTPVPGGLISSSSP